MKKRNPLDFLDYNPYTSDYWNNPIVYSFQNMIDNREIERLNEELQQTAKMLIDNGVIQDEHCILGKRLG